MKSAEYLAWRKKWADAIETTAPVQRASEIADMLPEVAQMALYLQPPWALLLDRQQYLLLDFYGLLDANATSLNGLGVAVYRELLLRFVDHNKRSRLANAEINQLTSFAEPVRSMAVDMTPDALAAFVHLEKLNSPTLNLRSLTYQDSSMLEAYKKHGLIAANFERPGFVRITLTEFGKDVARYAHAVEEICSRQSLGVKYSALAEKLDREAAEAMVVATRLAFSGKYRNHTGRNNA